jgi:hypothetical protein
MIRHKQFKQVPVAFLFSKDGGPTSLYLQVHDKLCSVGDPHYFDADQDFAFHLYADTDKIFTIMWIRIRLLTLMLIRIPFPK